MVQYSGTTEEGSSTGETFLKYAGVAGIAVALLLTVAVVGLTVAPALVPSGPAVATVLFTAVLAVAVLATRLGNWAGQPDVDLDPEQSDLPGVRNGE
jgi:hypothetical protein